MAYVVVSLGGEEIARHPLSGPAVIGRSVDAQISVRDASLSRWHCQIEPSPGSPDEDAPANAGAPREWLIVDLGSRNGTTVNGRKVSRQMLHHGDLLRVGRVNIYFSAESFVPAQPAPLIPLPVPSTRAAMPAVRAVEALAAPSPSCPLLVPATRLPRPLPGEVPQSRPTYDTIDVLSSPGWSRQIREMPSPCIEASMNDCAARESSRTLDLSTVETLSRPEPVSGFRRFLRALGSIFRR